MSRSNNTPLEPTISVIIPVYKGGQAFRKCLLSIVTATPPPSEVIVVVDGEPDSSSRLAEEFGVQIMNVPVVSGPARARNLGAKRAISEILVFLDADVTIQPDAIDRIADVFRYNPAVAAVFGSYDDTPFESNFLSQYKNLLHHYIHQTSNAEASTFWAGCGAIRRKIFLKMGGFDERYKHPSIEDIELGYRLKKAGYQIYLAKELQVKHLKHWGLFSLLKADIFYRALPWTALILRNRQFINDLNLKTSGRISVVAVYLLLLIVLGNLCNLTTTALCSWFFAVFLVIVLLVLNWDLYRFFFQKRGFRFTLMTIPWHWSYFFYSGLMFSIGTVQYQLKRFKLHIY
jgi:GT2 family glycosyltransferase